MIIRNGWKAGCIVLQVAFGLSCSAMLYGRHWPQAVACGIACGIFRGLRNVFTS